MSMWVSLSPPSSTATRTPVPRAPASQASGAWIACGPHWTPGKKVSLSPMLWPVASSVTSMTRSFGSMNWYSASSATACTPEILEAWAWKLEELEVATASPMAGVVLVRVPPAAVTAASRLAGSLLPLPRMTYELPATAAAMVGRAAPVFGAMFSGAQAASVSPMPAESVRSERNGDLKGNLLQGGNGSQTRGAVWRERRMRLAGQCAERPVRAQAAAAATPPSSPAPELPPASQATSFRSDVQAQAAAAPGTGPGGASAPTTCHRAEPIRRGRGAGAAGGGAVRAARLARPLRAQPRWRLLPRPGPGIPGG